MIRNASIAAATAALIASPLCLADRVTLQNGSVLVGQINEVADDTVSMSTEFAGELSIDLARVAAFETDASRSIVLDSGDAIVGVLLVEDGKQIIRSDRFGDLEIRVSDVESMGAEGGIPRRALTPREGETEQEAEIRREYEREVEEIQSAADARVAELEAKVEKLESPWSGSIDFAVGGNTGPTEKFFLNAGANATRETEFDLLEFYLRANWTTENGENSENEVIGGSRYEYNITDRFYVYGRGFLEYDEFEDLQLRAVVAGGPGYYFIKNDRTRLKGWAGAGYRYESYLSDKDDLSEGIIDLGYELRTKLWENIDFVHSGVYNPSLGDLTEFRLNLTTTLDWRLAGTDGWAVRAGMWNQFNSDPSPGVPHWDTSYVLGLAYKW